MLGIIPAAGKGTRLGLPFPKELLPITQAQNQPISVLEGSLLQLINAKIDKAIIVVRPQKAAIREHLGYYKHGVNIQYVDQYSHRSIEGLPDAVSDCRDYARDYDLCVMLMGDTYFTDPDVVKELIAKIQEYPGAIACVSAWLTGEPERFGIIESHTGQVTSVVDKPVHLQPPQTFWGAVAFRPAFWSYIQNEKQTFSQALHRAVDKGIIVHAAGGKYLDLGTPVAFFDAVKEVNP